MKYLMFFIFCLAGSYFGFSGILQHLSHPIGDVGSYDLALGTLNFVLADIQYQKITEQETLDRTEIV